MTIRRILPCLPILFTLAALTWLQNLSFAQNPYPGNNPGVAQPGTTGIYNPTYQQPTGGGQTMGGQAVGNQNTAPPNNHMMDRPMGMLPGGLQPGNPPQMQNARNILPPPEGLQIGEEKQKYINGFLAAWHEQSKNIETLDYEFTRREYNSFSPQGEAETYGRVKFHAPDKGMIEIHSEKMRDGKVSTETNKKMKVICTGEAVYEFNFEQKKLTEFIIPVEQRGKGVMDSPLMILAGANPRELQERFYLDVFPSPPRLSHCVCINAWPKWPEDGKEFKYVTLAVNRNTFQAEVLLLFEPGTEDYKGYEIKEVKKKFRPLGGILPPIDDFDRNKILASKPRDWTFETKTDFLPEASGQRMAQQPYPPVNATSAPVSPHYGNQPNLQPNMPSNNTGYNTVTPGVVPQGQPGIVPQGTTGMAVPYNGVNPNNQPQPYNRIAMPPQNYSGSQSVFR